ncbi:unnamed protein product, partial [Polarella glacialis]
DGARAASPKKAPGRAASPRGVRKSSGPAPAPGPAPGPGPGLEHDFEAEVSRCSQALQYWAKCVTTAHIREMRSLKRPPPQVAKIFEAIALLLEESGVRPTNYRKLLSDNLAGRLAGVDPASITASEGSRLRNLLEGVDVRQEQIARSFPPALGLATWCECLSAFLSRTSASWRAAHAEGALPYPQSSSQESARDEPLPTAGPQAAALAINGRSASHLDVEPDLSRLSPEELLAVSELTVTLPEVGSVVFHGLTDCAELDIDKMVVLKKGYVLVYPDSKTKPPAGQGLNKRSTVTMYQCFPPGEAVIDEDNMDYKNKIQKMTEENSACTFLDYNCQTGVWKFEVDHF